MGHHCMDRTLIDFSHSPDGYSAVFHGRGGLSGFRLRDHEYVEHAVWCEGGHIGINRSPGVLMIQNVPRRGHK